MIHGRKQKRFARCDHEKYGEPGSVIPGSRYIRAYCHECGTALRASPIPKTDDEQGDLVLCIDCGGPTTKGSGRRMSDTMPTDDISPIQSNAIRAMEGD